MQPAEYHRNKQARLPWPCQPASKLKAKETVPGKRKKRKEKLNLSKNIVPEHWQGQGQVGLRVV